MHITDLSYAEYHDKHDSLAHFRAHFIHADPELVYLDGNSLGCLPRTTLTLAQHVVQQQWGERLIRGWNEGWFTLPEQVGAKIARLIGADPDEVIVADSTSVNLFKLAVAALRYQRGRRRILSDTLNFPSDVYVLQGALDILDQQHTLELVPSADGIHGPEEELCAALNEQVALLTLSHVVFKSGYQYDMGNMNAAAHAVGALTLWDFSHSVGAVPIDVHASGCDMAIGCGYKFLNGGPGAPAFIYMRRDLQQQLHNPISGWMGQRNLFTFDLQYAPADGLRHFLTGTPAVISMALLEPGVDMLLVAGMEALRTKSLNLSSYLIMLWEAQLADLGFTLNSPRDPQRRGSHVSLGHVQGLGIDLALIREFHVLPDFRPPDNLRLGIAPLYNSFTDILKVVEALHTIVTQRVYEKYTAEIPTVT